MAMAQAEPAIASTVISTVTSRSPLGVIRLVHLPSVTADVLVISTVTGVVAYLVVVVVPVHRHRWFGHCLTLIFRTRTFTGTSTSTCLFSQPTQNGESGTTPAMHGTHTALSWL